MKADVRYFNPSHAKQRGLETSWRKRTIHTVFCKEKFKETIDKNFDSRKKMVATKSAPRP